MKKTIWLMLLLFLLLEPAQAAQPLEEIVRKLSENFARIRDATADITLDYNLYLLGCGGLERWQGKGYFKAPNKIKVNLDGTTYFARGNTIYKIDKEGKKFYIRLLHSIDMSIGFHPGLIPHNFFLSIFKEQSDEVILEGLPKPGTLKNVKKVMFHIDTKEYLLRKLDVIFENKSLSGSIKIDYRKMGNLWVPVGFHGKTAVETPGGTLVGIGIKLKGENIKINSGLPDRFFNPGF